MTCEQCGYFVNKATINQVGYGYCNLKMGLKQSVDGCVDGQVQVEEYEDRALYGFDDMERLVKV